MARSSKPVRAKLVGAMVTPDEHARINAEARRRGVTVSAMLYDLLAPVLAQIPEAVAPPPPAKRRQMPPAALPRRAVFPPHALRDVSAAAEGCDVTAMLMGDPPPERSALARR
jgi:hypothetical protein